MLLCDREMPCRGYFNATYQVSHCLFDFRKADVRAFIDVVGQCSKLPGENKQVDAMKITFIGVMRTRRSECYRRSDQFLLFGQQLIAVSWVELACKCGGEIRKMPL